MGAMRVYVNNIPQYFHAVIACLQIILLDKLKMVQLHDWGQLPLIMLTILKV